MYIPTEREKALLKAFYDCAAAELPQAKLLAAAGGRDAAAQALAGCIAKGFIAQNDDGACLITEKGRQAL